MNKTMERIADAISNARNGGTSRALGNYSVVVVPDWDTVAVVYRLTTVASFYNGNIDKEQVILHDGGWRTLTTKNVMNAALADTRYHVYQKDYQWFIRSWRKDEPDIKYFDGITLDATPAA